MYQQKGDGSHLSGSSGWSEQSLQSHSNIWVGPPGHQLKAGEAVYVRRCAPAEVIPQSQTNCMEEIPALHNGTEIFVDLISNVIKSAGSPVYGNYVAPPRYKLGRK